MFRLEKYLDYIAPHLCLGCGSEGSVLCDWCAPELLPSLPERCYRCRAQSQNSAVCAKCRHHSRLQHVWVVTEYEAAAKALIHKLKFERAAAAARPAAMAMAQSLPYLDTETIVIHLPTAPGRVRQRGYDQAKLLAHMIGRERKLAHCTALIRMSSERQVGAGRAARLEHANGFFRVADNVRGKLKSADILLVDDIVTTGASLEAASRLLSAAGARSVNAVVFAQKQ